MTNAAWTPSFSKFRTELDQEVIRQRVYNQKTPSLHNRRTTDMELNPRARTSMIVLLNTGMLPVFVLANLMECVFFKDIEDTLPELWNLQSAGPRSCMRVYLTNIEIAMHKVKQANGWLQQSAWRLGIPTAELPMFLIEEFKV